MTDSPKKGPIEHNRNESRRTIDSRLIRKLSRIAGSEAFMIMGAIELNNVEGARLLALDPNFIRNNPKFLESGELIRLSIRKGFIEFTKEALETGYILPEDILIKAIKKNDLESISNIIYSQLYPKDGFELEYWYLIYKKHIASAETMRANEPVLQQFQIIEQEFDGDLEILEVALKRALERGYDDFACIILKSNPSVITPEMIEIALNTKSIDFLRRIWTGSQMDNTAFGRINRLKISEIWDSLNNKSSDSKKIELSNVLNISYIIKSLLQRNLIQEARKVIIWPDAANDKEILKVCIEMGEEEIARDVVKYRTVPVTRKDIESSLDKKCYWLALDILKWDDPAAFLLTKEAQDKIVDLLKSGSTCYFAAELFARIIPSCWHSVNTENVCKEMSFLLKKSQEFYKCPQPILFLVLMAEFLNKIAPVNIYYTTLCKSVSKESILMAQMVENNIDEETEMSYFLNCEDTQGRTALTVIALNDFFELLENNDVGSIVNNMWVGDRKNEGILKASTIYSSFTAPSGSDEKLAFFSKIDSRQAYMFQYDQLVNSCQLRFLGQIVSISFLVFFYSVMVELAHEESTLDNFADGKRTEGFLRLSQVWVVGIFLEKIITIVFCFKTGRTIIKDVWLFIDFFMFVMMIFLMAGVNQYYAGPGKWLDFVGSGDFNALMHSVVLCLVWLKLFNILKVTITYGPLLRIMYLMTVDMMTFLLVYFSSLFIGAVIMATLFSRHTLSTKFKNFGTSFQTLYRIGLGDFELNDYRDYGGFGAVMESILTLLTNVLLFNVLIAVLSVTYEREVEGEEAKYRATLIKSHYRWKWDENFGLLILMPSPITIFITSVLPLLLVVKNPSRVTNLFSKIFFLLFVIPMFIFFAAGSAVFVPLVYFTSLEAFAKGGIKKLQQKKILEVVENEEDTESDEDIILDDNQMGNGVEEARVKTFSKRRAVIWIIIGMFVCVLAYLRDLCDFWRIIFKSSRLNMVNVEDEEGNILTNEKFITTVQKTLEKIKESEIPVDRAVEEFINLDNSSLSSIVLGDRELMKKREESIEKYFLNLAYSQKQRLIRKADILEMLPVKNYYSKNYIYRAQHIRVTWIAKALKSFRKSASNINIKGVQIPKYVMFNETYKVKRVLTTTKNAKVNLDLSSNYFKVLETYVIPDLL